MEYKVCSNCKRNLPKEQFTKSSNYKDGLNYICKECAHKKYLRDKEKKKVWDKKYTENNKEKISKYQKEYRDKNRAKTPKGTEEYECLKEKWRTYQKEYRKDPKNRKKEYEYQKQRRKKDALFDFKKKTRSFIVACFIRSSKTKNKKTVDILGCDFEFFRDHLHKTFFDNYGYNYDGKEKVHIDHIVPLSMAKTEEDVIKLCHYTNLQLLKPEDNLRKSNKIDFVL